MAERKTRNKSIKTSPRGGRRRRKFGSYPFDFRLRVVRLYLEEGYSKPLIISEMGVSNDTINKWLERYREFGEEGLKDRPRTGKRKKTQKNVKKKIVSVKKSHPEYGPRRISDVLKRFFWKIPFLEPVISTIHIRSSLDYSIFTTFNFNRN